MISALLRILICLCILAPAAPSAAQTPQVRMPPACSCPCGRRAQGSPCCCPRHAPCRMAAQMDQDRPPLVTPSPLEASPPALAGKVAASPAQTWTLAQVLAQSFPCREDLYLRHSILLI